MMSMMVSELLEGDQNRPTDLESFFIFAWEWDLYSPDGMVSVIKENY